MTKLAAESANRIVLLDDLGLHTRGGPGHRPKNHAPGELIAARHAGGGLNLVVVEGQGDRTAENLVDEDACRVLPHRDLVSRYLHRTSGIVEILQIDAGIDVICRHEDRVVLHVAIEVVKQADAVCQVVAQHVALEKAAGRGSSSGAVVELDPLVAEILDDVVDDVDTADNNLAAGGTGIGDAVFAIDIDNVGVGGLNRVRLVQQGRVVAVDDEPIDGHAAGQDSEDVVVRSTCSLRIDRGCCDHGLRAWVRLGAVNAAREVHVSARWHPGRIRRRAESGPC